MNETLPSDKNDQSLKQPTYRQMGRYAVIGTVATLAMIPLIYARWMRKSPLPWLSDESFHNFGWFVLGTGVIVVLILIGSHGDEA